MLGSVLELLVRTEGLEPSRGHPLRILSPVCLPVPPRPRRRPLCRVIDVSATTAPKTGVGGVAQVPSASAKQPQPRMFLRYGHQQPAGADAAGAKSNTPRAFFINANSSSGLSTSMRMGILRIRADELVRNVAVGIDKQRARHVRSVLRESAVELLFSIGINQDHHEVARGFDDAGILENLAEAFAHRTPRRVKDHDDRPAGLRCLVDARARVAPVDFGAIPEIGVVGCACSRPRAVWQEEGKRRRRSNEIMLPVSGINFDLCLAIPWRRQAGLHFTL